MALTKFIHKDFTYQFSYLYPELVADLLENCHLPLTDFMQRVETYYGPTTRQRLDTDSVVTRQTLRVAEWHLYGSSRLGIYKTQDTLRTVDLSLVYELSDINLAPTQTLSKKEFYSFDSTYTHHRGDKLYEGSNHLGNVLVTFSDKRLAECTEGQVHYQADVRSAKDYAAFGALLDDRQWFSGLDSGVYRAGFNGMEKDDEVKGVGNSYDFGARIYDSRLGRFLSIDPDAYKYPFMSTYCFSGNSPIYLTGGDGRGPKPYVRLLFYGGAKLKRDNSAFYYAAQNVKNDYGSDCDVQSHFAESGQSVIDKINSQDENSIQSIDFFTHGSQYALYMLQDRKAEKPGSVYASDIPEENVEENNLYASKTARFFQSGRNAGSGTREINSIDVSKFTNDAKIEIHGCNTAGSTIAIDNMATNLSEQLYAGGKLRTVVIGHNMAANPNINSDPIFDKDGKQLEQDYRHGSRVVYHNGSVLFTTRIKGRITGKMINHYLNKKETEGGSYKSEEYTKKTKLN